MPHKINRKDLPLYLTILFLRGLLASPLGDLVLKLGNKHLVPAPDNWFEVTQLQLILPRLPPQFSGYRLAQLSDLHLGTWATKTHLMEAVQAVNTLQPDLVALTGDFVTHRPDLYVNDLIEIFNGIESKDGIVAVLGNHDHWTDPDLIRGVLSRAGIIELNNQLYTIRRGDAELHIAGVDDIMEELHDLEAIAEKIGDARGAILLAHEPDIADEAALTGMFDFQISGHTHGGQVRLPKLGALILPRLGKKYSSGLYQVNGMQLYTNRGLGTAELQFRYNCSAEVVCFELISGMTQA